MKVKNILSIIEKRYPLNSQLSFDNSGANIVNFEDEVKNILVTLDISLSSINYAIKNDVNLIISHHPIIFNEIKTINDDILSKKIKLLIKNNINAYSMHTNFDSNIKYGMGNLTTYTIFEKKMIKKNAPLFTYYVDNKKFGMGNNIILNKPISFNSLLDLIVDKLNIEQHKMSYYDITHNEKISRIAIMPGSGGSDVEQVIKSGFQVFITSDLKHNHIIDLLDAKVSYINATHFALENVFTKYMCYFLKKKFNCNILSYNLSDL